MAFFPASLIDALDKSFSRLIFFEAKGSPYLLRMENNSMMLSVMFAMLIVKIRREWENMRICEWENQNALSL